MLKSIVKINKITFVLVSIIILYGINTILIFNFYKKDIAYNQQQVLERQMEYKINPLKPYIHNSFMLFGISATILYQLVGISFS